MRTEPREGVPGRYVVAMTGSSGAIYGLRLVNALTELGHEVELIVSDPAKKVLRYEEGIETAQTPLDIEQLFDSKAKINLHETASVEALPASGSAAIDAMIICPCSMGTLGRVAHGYSIGLIERAADVALKEGRSLLLVPRETPLSQIHLENMLSLVRAGAIILPASPGFYHRPKSIDDLVDFVVGKILARLSLTHPMMKSWEGPEAEEEC